MCPQSETGIVKTPGKPLNLKVGTAGFEPTTSCTPSKRATRLRHVPKTDDLSRLASPLSNTHLECGGLAPL